jgi:polyhydroxyalkanoate synthesis repressor PhaR
MRVIKKYGNRRLYDTQDSRYINLGELADLIRARIDVQVVSVADGTDLTRVVLLQVLLETQGAAEILPAGMLHRVIRLSQGGPMTQLVREQFAAGLALLDSQLGQLERQFGWAAQGPAQAPPPPPSASEPSPAPSPEPPDQETEAQDDMAALRARLQALESRLKGGEVR